MGMFSVERFTTSDNLHVYAIRASTFVRIRLLGKMHTVKQSVG
jgi:hypothetical protein